ncbi:Spy/CpxP family protein refolding chaperone [Guyparkeria halopsychrophila]|uniref:Spy/CpxP family protein refolding chaperone n=1 Tax=Guyparkeria halopsychrophila TaxID=3139421 RepID=UPI0037C57F80
MTRSVRFTTTLLAASALALSGAAFASSGQQCPHHGDRAGKSMQAGPSGHGKHAQKGECHGGADRHERLAEMLDLDEPQREAFDAFVETGEEGRETRMEMRREMRREMMGASVPAQMEQCAEHMKEASERMAERADAMAAFYETLDENQQRMVDRMMGHQGKASHHGKGHQGGGCSRH